MPVTGVVTPPAGSPSPKSGGLEPECGAGLRFCLRGRVVVLAMSGRAGWGADEVEGLALLAGGLGEHGGWGVGAGEADVVAGVRVAKWASRPRKLR